MNLQIETTNRCNLVCKECPNRFMKRKRQDMTIETFDVILENYIKPLEGVRPAVILHKDGEPLLNENLIYFIQRIADVRPDIKIDIYTNGLLLTEDFVKFLGTINSSVRILVSFHFFQVTNQEPSFITKNETVLIKCLAQNHDNIDYVFVTHEFDSVDRKKLDQWKQNWVNRVTRFPNRLLNVAINDHINPWTGLIQDSHTIKIDTCSYSSFEHLFIGSTGNILPCCMDIDEVLALGNIMTTGKQLLFDRISHFYSLINDGNIERSLCQRCLK